MTPPRPLPPCPVLDNEGVVLAETLCNEYGWPEVEAWAVSHAYTWVRRVWRRLAGGKK